MKRKAKIIENKSNKLQKIKEKNVFKRLFLINELIELIYLYLGNYLIIIKRFKRINKIFINM